ncbi:MAG: hypothetical protein IJ849_12165 [Selenomonadaceae bacterium]|nr:hypothetical protein [Selenomonadaceae bacterium]
MENEQPDNISPIKVRAGKIGYSFSGIDIFLVFTLGEMRIAGYPIPEIEGFNLPKKDIIRFYASQGATVEFFGKTLKETEA